MDGRAMLLPLHRLPCRRGKGSRPAGRPAVRSIPLSPFLPPFFPATGGIRAAARELPAGVLRRSAPFTPKREEKMGNSSLLSASSSSAPR